MTPHTDAVQDPVFSIEEFELLVRGDWRRILGRDTYDRAHGARIVGPREPGGRP